MRGALRTAGVFAVLSSLWIFLSDSAVGLLTEDPAVQQSLQTAKGMLFVLVSACLVGFLAYRELRKEREHRERATAMIEENVAGLYVLQDGAFAAASRRVTEVLGYPPGGLNGKPLADIVTKEERALAVAHAEAGPARGNAPTSARFTVLRGDGRRVRVQLQGRGAEWDGREARVGVLLDVTHEEERETHLARRQKLEALGQLTGTVAHDFKNLLTAIIAPLELCGRQMHEDDPARKDADDALEAAYRAAALTKRLLAFSRQRPYSPAPADLSAITEQVGPILRHGAGSGVRLELLLERDLPAVEVDGALIEQALLNLVLNASEAMQGRGSIRVSTRSAKEGTGVGLVILEVSDDGPGVTPEARERLFDPFFTTKSDGTGLGLATVHRIAAQAGGSVAVDSQPGHGATFRLAFPVSDRTAALPRAPSEPDGEEPEEWPAGVRVLVVEDERAIRAVACRILGRFGFEVLPTSTGAEAIALIAGLDGSVDLLVCDVGLPDVNGYDFADSVEGLVPGVRVLMMSGNSEDDSRSRMGGSRPFLEKPFSIADFAQAVREALQSEALP